MNSVYGVSISCTHFTGEQVVVWLQRPSSDWLAGVPKGRRGGVEARWQGLQGPTQVAIRFGKFNQTGNVWPDLSDNIALPLFLSNRLLNNHLTTWVEVLVFFIGVEVLVYITEKLSLHLECPELPLLAGGDRVVGTKPYRA